jgi:hypothetical protein
MSSYGECWVCMCVCSIFCDNIADGQFTLDWWYLVDSLRLHVRSSTGSMLDSTGGDAFQLRLLSPYWGLIFGNLFINGTGSWRAVYWLVSPSTALISFLLLFSTPINRGTDVT